MKKLRLLVAILIAIPYLAVAQIKTDSTAMKEIPFFIYSAVQQVQKNIRQHQIPVLPLVPYNQVPEKLRKPGPRSTPDVILLPKNFPSRMPVYKSDSTVHYFLKVLK